MLGLQQGAGYSGALLAFGANLYYIVLIRRQQATPHPVTWMVWTLIGALGAVSTVEAGAGPGALVPIAYAMVYALTSYYAVQQFRSHRRDDENAITRYDLLLGAGAVLLAIAWKVADLGPGWLAALAVTADLFALAPTLRYTWTQPTTGAERQVWITDTLATALGLSAVSLPWTAAAIAYPGYLVAGNASVTAVMWLRSRQRLPSADPCIGQTTA
jgi:hypothetical protein